jgi:hypothetical protein
MQFIGTGVVEKKTMHYNKKSQTLLAQDVNRNREESK